MALHPSPRSRPLAPVLVALSFVALALSACSGGGDEGGGDGGGGPAQAATVADPLTGAQVAPDVAERPAVSVKVDNAEPAIPLQTGIDKADVVFEEKVEGTVTRLVAVFHSEDAELVGPIRSLRTTDPAIVSPFKGVFAFSDSAAVAMRSLQGAPVEAVFERQGSAPFVYPPGSRRPYSTFARTERLRREADEGADPPPSFTPFLGPGEAFQPQARPATKATVVFGPRTTAVLDWDPAGARWLRSTNGRPHVIKGGARLAFTTVIVQKVAYRPVGYRDASGHPVDEAVVVGAGDAVILSAGRQVAGRWSKPSATAMTSYTDANGAPVELPPGRTLVLLLPVGAGVTVS